MADDLSQYGVVSTAPPDLSQYGTIDTPKLSKVSQAISNIPASAMRAASNAGPMSGIPSQQTIKPGHDDPKSPNYIPFSSAENFMGDLKSLKDKFGHFMEHPVDNAIDMFVKDPVVGALGIGALIKGGKEAGPAVADAAKAAAAKLPPKVIEAAGAGAGYMVGHEIGGYGVGAAGAYAGRELGKSIANKLKAPEPPAYPPIYDDISKGLGGGAYKDLSAEAQHAIQSIAEKLDAPKVAPRTASSSAPLPEAASTPGLTVNELITKELEAKRGAAPVPAQASVGAVQRPAPQEVTGVGVPLRPPLAQPTPITATPEAVSPTPAPTVSSTLAAPAPTAPTPIDAGNPIPEAYRSMESSGLQIPQEASARSGIANKLAEHLHKNGITTQELDIIDGNPEAMKLFWDNASQLPGLSKQSHYSASPATIAAAKVALKDLEGTKVVPATPEAAPAYLTNNPKALKAAKAMAKEVMKPVSVGDLMGATKKVRKVKE